MTVVNKILVLSLLFVAVDSQFLNEPQEPMFRKVSWTEVKKKMENEERMIDMEPIRDVLNRVKNFRHNNDNKVAKELGPKVSLGGKVLQVNGFSWSSCSKEGDPSNLTSLTLGPDPLKLPGNVSLGFSGQLKVDLVSPISLDLKIKKKVLFWIEIPCVDNVGSCNYQDICKMLPTIKCPPEFQKYGIPCNCPIKANTYTLPATSFYVNPIGVPSWLEKGEYEATARMSQGKQEITCLNIKLSIG